jgi:hypothetical protein
MRAAVEKENVVVFFSFWRNHVIQVERSRPVGPDRLAGLETSRLDRTVHA